MAPVPASARTIAPMKPTLVDRLPTDDEQWSYEVKWDGMRAIAFIDAGRLRLQTSNRLDATARFPELIGLGSQLAGHTAVLDGEVVALDARGLPDFSLLQPLIPARTTRPFDVGVARPPVLYVLFDLLELDGHDTSRLPYQDRRQLLRRLVPPGPHWRVAEAQVGKGTELLASLAAAGLEGVVAKRLGSRYEAGARSASWLKVKVRKRQELVVGGWLPGDGARLPYFGALLVGYHDTAGGPLRYAGRVGTGFTDAELRRWRPVLDDLAADEPPFDPLPPEPVSRLATWVRPEAVVEVAFREWTPDGLLRQAAYRGQRSDKEAAAVVREG